MPDPHAQTRLRRGAGIALVIAAVIWVKTSAGYVRPEVTPDDGPEYQESWSTAKADRTIRMVGRTMAQIEACLIQFGPDESWPTLPSSM